MHSSADIDKVKKRVCTDKIDIGTKVKAEIRNSPGADRTTNENKPNTRGAKSKKENDEGASNMTGLKYQIQEETIFKADKVKVPADTSEDDTNEVYINDINVIHVKVDDQNGVTNAHDDWKAVCETGSTREDNINANKLENNVENSNEDVKTMSQQSNN